MFTVDDLYELIHSKLLPLETPLPVQNYILDRIIATNITLIRCTLEKLSRADFELAVTDLINILEVGKSKVDFIEDKFGYGLMDDSPSYFCEFYLFRNLLANHIDDLPSLSLQNLTKFQCYAILALVEYYHFYASLNLIVAPNAIRGSEERLYINALHHVLAAQEIIAFSEAEAEQLIGKSKTQTLQQQIDREKLIKIEGGKKSIYEPIKAGFIQTAEQVRSEMEASGNTKILMSTLIQKTIQREKKAHEQDADKLRLLERLEQKDKSAPRRWFKNGLTT